MHSGEALNRVIGTAVGGLRGRQRGTRARKPLHKPCRGRAGACALSAGGCPTRPEVGDLLRPEIVRLDLVETREDSWYSVVHPHVDRASSCLDGYGGCYTASGSGDVSSNASALARRTRRRGGHTPALRCPSQKGDRRSMDLASSRTDRTADAADRMSTRLL